MKHQSLFGLVAGVFSLIALTLATAQGASPLVFTDSRGEQVVFSLGAVSFVDAVESYTPGGKIPRNDVVDPSQALDLPDFDRAQSTGFVTLGCNGKGVWRFTDNSLVDVPGPDLWIFEIGPDVEGMRVEVSVNGSDWIDLGLIEGNTSGVDLGGRGVPETRYQYVRLTDDGVKCHGSTPGADIDAIGAIGSVELQTVVNADNFVLPAQIISQSYDNMRGGEVNFASGEASFVDTVISYSPGGNVPYADATDPTAALQAPDYHERSDSGYVTLGCGGSGIFRFDDNTLINVPGPDLFIFEIGPDVEGTAVAISPDGKNWVEVGAVKGATSAIDIAQFIAPDETFRYVRLTDDGLKCSGRTPGADIDAIGAIGSGSRVVLDANILFDFDNSELQPAAQSTLDNLARSIISRDVPEIVIEGHTDSLGSEAYNHQLSERRAEAVKGALVKNGVLPARVQTRGLGETRPEATNETEAGRLQNRRVEVFLIGG